MKSIKISMKKVAFKVIARNRNNYVKFEFYTKTCLFK